MEQNANGATARATSALAWEELKALNIRTTEMLHRHQAEFARRQYRARHGSLDESKPDKWYVDQLHTPAPATQQKYRTSGRKQVELAMAAGLSPWNIIECNAGSKRSWNTRRAAVQFYVVTRIRELKRAIDKLGRGPVSLDEMRAVMEELPFLAKTLETLPQGVPAKFLPGSGFKPVRMSKSKSLAKAPPNWEEQVAKKLSSTYLRFWLVQCATGCRPSELSKGFSVERRNDGTLVIGIRGAKVGPFSGQPQRLLVLSIATEGWAVQMLAAKLKPDVVLRGLRQERSTNAYCKAIKRACNEAFPGLALSAYSARHQKKADLKMAGVDRVGMAKVLGHRTTRSATYYGRAVRGRAGSVKPVAVQATHAVKVRAKFVQRKTPTPHKQAEAMRNKLRFRPRG